MKDWQVSGGKLRVEFYSPATTGVQVRLDLVPKRPFGIGDVSLPLPTPLGVQTSEGALAYRAEGLQATFQSSQGVGFLKAPEFVSQWKQLRGLDLLPVPAYACYFRRETPPTLVVRFSPLEAVGEATLEASWQLRSQQADLALRATLKAARPAGFALVDWNIPESVTIAGVSGPDVRSWSRSGNRMQVWLQKNVTATELSLTGWWVGSANTPRPFPATLRSETWELPRLSLVGGTPTKTTVKIRSEAGWGVEPLKLQKLSVETNDRESALIGLTSELTLTAQAADYQGTFLLRPAPAGASPVQAFTLAEIRDGHLVVTVRFTGRVPAELRSLIVRMRSWEGEGVRLTGSSVARVREGPDHSWQVTLKPPFPRRLDLTLTAGLPLEKLAQGVALPEVVLEADPVPGLTWWLGVPQRPGRTIPADRWLAVVGPGLLGQAPHKLEPMTEGEPAWKSWPRDLQRAGREGTTLWKVLAEGWSLRLAPWGPIAGAGRAPIRVFLIEHAASAGGGRWQHQATCWLFVTASTDLQVGLPRGAELRAATVNGDMVMPVPSGEGTWWLPLAGGAGPRCLRLRWTSSTIEDTRRPNLTNPRLVEGAAETEGDAGPLNVWMIDVPSGYHTIGTGAGPESAAPAILDLRRAEAQLQLSRALIQTVRRRGERLTEESALDSELAAVQKTLRDPSRPRAEITPDTSTKFGPRGTKLDGMASGPGTRKSAPGE